MQWVRLSCLALSLVILAVAASSVATAAEGYTPYPDPKNETAWPGHGPIRAFPFMVGERAQFEKQREKDQGAVAFVGDSLTGGWKGLAKSFPELKVANRGVGGDVSRGVLFRFREDVLELKPRAVVICVGFNDLTAYGDPADAVHNIADVLDQAWDQNPELPIVVCQIPPRDAPQAPMKPGALADLNARIAKLGEGKPHLIVLDLITPFTGADGKPNPELLVKDHVHLNEAGYQKWAESLRPALEKLGVK